MGVPGLERSDGTPSLTTIQEEALDVLESVAQQLKLSLYSRPGDLIYVNNLALLHARQGFQDTATESRYLVRMWLKNDHHAWKLPPRLQLQNDRIYDETTVRDYNILPKVRLVFPVEERLDP